MPVDPRVIAPSTVSIDPFSGPVAQRGNALRQGRRATSYRSMARRIETLTEVLARAGAGSTSRILVALPPGPTALAYMFAAWRRGATILMGSPPEVILAAVANAAPPDFIVATDGETARDRGGSLGSTSAGRFAMAHPELQIVASPPDADRSTLGRLVARLFDDRPDVTAAPNAGSILREVELKREASARSVSPDDRHVEQRVIPADAKGGSDVAVESPGTGIAPPMLSRDAIATAVALVEAAMPRPIRQHDQVLVALPTSSALLPILAMAVWRAGATLILPRSCGLDDVCAEIDRSRPKTVMAPTAVIAQLPHHGGAWPHRFQRCLAVVALGDPPPATTVDKLLATFHADLGCLWTVAGGIPAASGRASVATGLQLVPLPDTDVGIIDFAAAGDGDRELPRGERGEVVLRGPQFGACVVRTGVIAAKEASGRLLVYDRIADLITASGYQIFPRRIEEALASHPAVAAAAVVSSAGMPGRSVPVVADGRARPGPQSLPAPLLAGSRPLAVVELHAASSRARDVGPAPAPDDLLVHIKPLLSRIEWPAEIVIRASLPRDAYGGVDKAALIRELKAEWRQR